MEKTKFKDVAHLYLGCSIIWARRKGNIKKITPLTISDYPFLMSKDYCMPILRSLSDWGLEEQKEWKKIYEDHVPSFGGDQILSAKQTVHLLSKHFDLFGLIESGEAIDATTLSHPIPKD